LNDDAKKFKVSHGSPEFYSAFKVKLEGDGSDSEGIFTNDYEFKKGYVYRVYLQGYQDIDRPTSYQMFIANGIEETQDTLCEPDFPAQYDNRVLVLADTAFNYDGDKDKWSLKYSPTERDYSQLWLTHIQPSAGAGSFYLKSIKIENYGRDTEPPNAPSDLQSSEIDTNAFRLTWNEPNDNYNGVDYYKVYINDNIVKDNISSTSVTITVDQDCHTYPVRVTAVDVAGNESAYSDTLFVTTAFNPPTCTIDGPMDALCSNSSASFSTNDQDNVSFDWSVGNGLNLNDDYNHETTVTANDTHNGKSYVEVTVSYNRNCPNGDTSSNSTRDIWVGAPQFSLSGMKELYTYDMGTVVVDYGLANGINHADQGSPTMDWSFTGPLISITGDYRKADYNSSHQTGYGWIYGESTNQCGSTTEDFYYEVTDDGLLMTMAPVPADDQLTVTLGNSLESMSTTQTINSKKYECYLYNNHYQLVKHKKVQGPRFHIYTNDLPEGFYFLNLVNGEKVLKKKLEIRHN